MAWSKGARTVTESGEELVFVKGPPAGGCLIVVIAVWLAGGMVTTGNVVRLMLFGLPFSHPSNASNIPNALHDPQAWIVLGILSVLCLFSAGVLFWSILSGPTVMRLTQQEVVVIKQFGKRRTSVNWLLAEMRQFHLARVGGKNKQYAIKFTYQGKVVSLAPQADRESTERILQALQSRVRPAGG